MSNSAQFYLDRIHNSTGHYRATWFPPDRPIHIGDLVKINDEGGLSNWGSLKGLGIEPEVEATPSSANMDLSYRRDVQIQPKLAGKVPLDGILSKAEAGINVKFNKGNEFIFEIAGYTTHVITNVAAIAVKVLELYKSGQWDKELLIVTELITADTATIIISGKGSSSLDLKLSADADIGDVKLTDASLQLKTGSKTGDVSEFISLKGISPLYKVMGLKGWFSKHLRDRDIAGAMGAADDVAPELMVVEPSSADDDF
jgi:hypothetical protein